MCEYCERLKDAIESGDFEAAKKAQQEWIAEKMGPDVASFATEGILGEEDFKRYKDKIDLVIKSAEFLVIEALQMLLGSHFNELMLSPRGTAAAHSLRNLAVISFGYGVKSGRRKEMARQLGTWMVAEDERH